MLKILSNMKKLIFSRIVIVMTLIALQIAIFLLFIIRFVEYFAIMYVVFLILSMLVILHLVNKEDNPSYKLAWSVPILLFPLFGGLVYLLLGDRRLPPNMKKMHSHITESVGNLRDQDVAIVKQLKEFDKDIFRQSQYLLNMGFCLYKNTDTIYHPSGESKFEAMCKLLESAKRYIFLEYFIIEEGVMWHRILDILERKVKEGVEVRVIYDGFGCLLTLPNGYYKHMTDKGIKCVEFNPLIPVITMLMNNRDHRKILVVDGHTGFMGGVNLADEYINVVEKHGHWKDTAVEIHGDAVISLTVMFLAMWQGITGSSENYTNYKPLPQEINAKGIGFVQPYADSPLDNALVGEDAYLNIINHAKDYVHICTPYLIVDNEMTTALIRAAQSGVDVKIITPHKGDKWYVHRVTRAYYQQFIEGGVKIYEYTPGFMHGKNFVSDDKIAIVGTVNLDFRSFYLHFECGLWMYRTPSVLEIEKDFTDTLAISQEITLDSSIIKMDIFHNMITAILRLFAPLM